MLLLLRLALALALIVGTVTTVPVVIGITPALLLLFTSIVCCFATLFEVTVVDIVCATVTGFTGLLLFVTIHDVF